MGVHRHPHSRPFNLLTKLCKHGTALADKLFNTTKDFARLRAREWKGCSFNWLWSMDDALLKLSKLHKASPGKCWIRRWGHKEENGCLAYLWVEECWRKSCYVIISLFLLRVLCCCIPHPSETAATRSVLLDQLLFRLDSYLWACCCIALDTSSLLNLPFDQLG